MTEFLDKLDFYVLPVVNIDGYIYTWTTVKEPILRGADEIKMNHSVTLVLTTHCTFRTACGERPVPPKLDLPALAQTSTETLMPVGAVSIRLTILLPSWKAQEVK